MRAFVRTQTQGMLKGTAVENEISMMTAAERLMSEEQEINSHRSSIHLWMVTPPSVIVIDNTSCVEDECREPEEDAVFSHEDREFFRIVPSEIALMDKLDTGVVSRKRSQSDVTPKMRKIV